MRWIKHMTATWNDEKIARLVGKGGIDGLAAYGLWWRVLEIVASQVDPKSNSNSVTYDVSRWSLLLSVRGSHVKSLLLRLEVTHLVTCEWHGTDLTVTIPNLLKYRDEYSQRSGQHRESVGRMSRRELDTDTDTDKEKKEIQKKEAARDPFAAAPAKSPPISKSRQEFEADWPHFWIRVGKESAYSAYVKARSKTSREKLMQSVREHGPQIVAQANREGRTPVHPATWLNAGRWDDDPAIYRGSNIRAGPGMDRKQKALEEFRRITNRDLEEHFAAQNH